MPATLSRSGLSSEAPPLVMKFDDNVLAQIFSPGGVLSRALPGEGREFEERPEQLKMAQAIAAAVREGSHLLVEAGTGTGKSYAYLVPLILWAVENKKRVLIATHTKALQQQLVERDLPFLHDLFLKRTGLNFEFALCLGSGNYLCPRRLKRVDALGLFASQNEVSQLIKLREFSASSPTGRNLDLPFEPLPQLWAQVNRESDLCLGRDCELYEKSPYYMARREQEKAHVLIANHHLLFSHIAAGGNMAALGGGGVLPFFDALVIDEAHHIEDVASDHLGIEVLNLAVARLTELLHNRRSNRTVLHAAGRDELEYKLIAAVDELREASGRFFDNLQNVTGLDVTRTQTLRLRRPNFMHNDLHEPLLRLESILREGLKAVGDEADGVAKDLDGYHSRCTIIRQSAADLIAMSTPDYVYWVASQPRMGEGGQRRMPRIALCGAPIEVAEALQDSVFSKISPVVMTSATLATGGNFEFLKQRLGFDDAVPERRVKTLTLGSPFDFRRNAMIYLGRDLPDPANGAFFESEAIKRAAELMRVTQGRAFVLCTSFRMVEATAAFLTKVLPREIRVLRQGEVARGRLLDEFRRDVSSILVGTTSFWQGVDVPGESLTCVVIMKLPFAVPDDPLVQARIEKLKSAGQDSFNGYQVPQAVMMFRQGFGRLIRTHSDRGVVAVLDPRVVTKNYGPTFLNSLPDCQVTDRLDVVEKFLQPVGEIAVVESPPRGEP